VNERSNFIPSASREVSDYERYGCVILPALTLLRWLELRVAIWRGGVVAGLALRCRLQ